MMQCMIAQSLMLRIVKQKNMSKKKENKQTIDQWKITEKDKQAKSMHMQPMKNERPLVMMMQCIPAQ